MASAHIPHPSIDRMLQQSCLLDCRPYTLPRGPQPKAVDWAAIYTVTRKQVLSPETNPWFFRGSQGSGIGGPHVGWGYAWPMALAMTALTSSDDGEIADCLLALVNSRSAAALNYAAEHPFSDLFFSL